jgi:tripartite-type tricarboxylate transporter receptor subunit TctC
VIRFLAALLIFAGLAHAQPLTFVTLTGAGSLSDTAIRQAAPEIEKQTGRPIVVVNMPGANGLIGVRYFLSQPSDQTVLVGNSSIGYLKAVGQFDGSLTPLAGLTKTDLAVYTSGSKNLFAAGSRDANLRAASTSPMTNISICMFDSQHRTATTIVPYKQFGQALIDTVEGRVDYVVAPSGAASLEGMVSAGRLRMAHLLGPKFGWNALFVSGNGINAPWRQGVLNAVKKTRFVGLNRFDATAIQITEIQQQEHNTISSCLKNTV